MNFFYIVLLTIIGFVSAEEYKSNVHLYTDENCASTPVLKRNLKTGECHTMDKDLVASDLNGQKYGIVKMSGDNAYEVYFFENHDKCKAYGSSFNKEVEVTFIRAPGPEECYVCEKCGNVKSVKFTKYNEQTKPSSSAEKPKETKKVTPKAEKPKTEDKSVANDAEDDSVGATGDNAGSSLSINFGLSFATFAIAYLIN